MAALIATWSFGLPVVDSGKCLLQAGRSSVDTVEQTLAGVEGDASFGWGCVGRGACPNAAGRLEYDSALMDGSHLKFGAVCAITQVVTPIRVARLVMDHSPHSILVGQGATDFAQSHGITLETNLGSHALYQEALEKADKGHEKADKGHEKADKGHDTLGLIARDSNGHLAAGVTTSGPKLKTPGRVGDSPLPGCGLYADDEYGAACATGDGDDILRFCPSYQVVRLLGNGLNPSQACQQVIKDIARRHGENMFEIGLIAMDTKGNTGAAGTVKGFTDTPTGKYYPGFPYATWSEDNDSSVLFQPSVI